MILLITYTEKHIEKEDLSLLHQIKQVIESISQIDLESNNNKEVELSCHMLADAISNIFEIEVRRGYFMAGYEHSWLITKNRNIIDVYPWGMVGGPFLISRHIISNNRPFYLGNNNLIADLSSESYKQQVKLVESALRKVILPI